MLQYLKNTLIMLVLAAFLVPASGVVVFMHQCGSMGSTDISLTGSNSCCATNDGAIAEADHSSCSITATDGITGYGDQLNKHSCCSDSKFYVKIIDDYLTVIFNSFQFDKTEIELFNITSLLPSPVVTGLIQATDTPDPPGIDTWLLVSSLRL